ncbi:MAG: glycogen synthase GlgA [Oceanicoccus sp.]|uniref:glycogen synthase GlgA n=1 Tax=Oceanicoccus sp. TaxID=2691044 RepID=UPI00260AEF16|nr:glycogen synthase GlgA [Oceanicoccus sp.]MCP3907132.1 glycogen synthase GlgA [Oceanicoccus sp.]MDG1772487.1 glycogen synthase GlgA [Oceanicoccus sp.]
MNSQLPPPITATDKPLKVLFASSEIYPLAKTGGLADVAFNLPKTLATLGVDIRWVMPAYKEALDLLKQQPIKSIALNGISLLETTLPETKLTLWLVDAPGLFDRSGGPYGDASSAGWPDNAERFYQFCQVISDMALGRATLDWQPDIVHCNDWHTGLVPAWLRQHPQAPATIFTVHNAAYQGLFPYSTFVNLGLDPALWRFDALEFHDQLCFIKGGLMFADWLTTVSPNYARELTQPLTGSGLDAIFRYRQDTFSGICNGIDTTEWNPEHDHYISQTYDEKTLNDKPLNKGELQKKFNLEQNPNHCVLGWVGRLSEQKGIDLLLDSLGELIKLPIQLVLLGRGDARYEQALVSWAQKHPQQIAVKIDYKDALAHQIIAGADFFLMPSGFEPCGLTQMYSQRYGTPPIASNVGGLVDTVVNITTESLSAGTASGILFSPHNQNSLLSAIKSAIRLYKNPETYRVVQQNAMSKDFSWQRSAQHYKAIYQHITASAGVNRYERYY